MPIDQRGDLGRAVSTITGRWSRSDPRDLECSGAEELWLNHAHGFGEPDLEFLSSLPNTVSRLHITAPWITDLEPVMALGDRLRSLHVRTAADVELDLTRLPHLTALGAEWQDVRASIASATRLRDVYLGGYREVDLVPLASLTALERLMMKDRPSIRSLQGLRHLHSLKHLTIVLARYLSDIDELGSAVGGQLETLDLDSCRRIGDLGPIAHCRALSSLNLGNIGDVPSAAPLAELDHLVHLYLHESTRFVDGDLRALLRLRRLQTLRMMRRRAYEPAVDEVEASLGLSGA